MKLHILDCIKEYAEKSPIRFHMPGHKAGDEFVRLFSGAELDITELVSVGNERAVELAEKDVAEIFGAKNAVLMSDGASMAIFSAVYAVKNLGRKLIISRASHKSIYNALGVQGIEPIIIDETDAKSINSELIEKAVVENDDVIGAFLTYPDYYGRTFDIEAVKNVLSKHGKKLLIDNAHGGHYAFTGEKAFAGDYSDITVISAHKVFSSLNQGAVLLCSDQTLTKRLAEGAGIFSTSSPSYPILASVEYGIKKAHSEREQAKIFCGKISVLKQAISKLNFNVLEDTDCFKLAIDFGESVSDAEKYFEDRGFFAEMNDGSRLLFMFSFATKDEQLSAFYRAVKGLSPTKGYEKTFVQPKLERVIGYLDALSAEKESVELHKAIGRICAVNAGLFPPCCPIIVAGEMITEEVVKLLSKPNVFGVKDGMIGVIKNR